MTDVTNATAFGRPSAVLLAVLAAGAGSRFVGRDHKLDADLDGRPLLHHAVAHAAASGVAEVAGVIVVTAGTLRECLPPTVVELVNPDSRRGLRSSLAIAIDHAVELGVGQLVVGLGDQPFVEPSAWRAVAAAGRHAPIAVATYDGERGHPVSLRADTWNLLAGASDDDRDRGAGALMRMRPELVDEVRCDGSATDIDTLEDLQRWQNS